MAPAGALQGPGAAHPEALPGALHPGHHGAHPALRRDDPGEEGLALRRPGRRHRRSAQGILGPRSPLARILLKEMNGNEMK